jgi:hypothetical protein
MLMTPAAAVAARRSRRVGDSDIADMTSSCDAVRLKIVSRHSLDRPKSTAKRV